MFHHERQFNMAHEQMLWQAMKLTHFNGFFKLKVLTLQKMSDKMNTEISNKMVNTQEYNYYKEFVKIVKGSFIKFLKAEYNELSKKFNETPDTVKDKEKYLKRREKFLEINNDIDKYLRDIYITIAKNTWFSCFYTIKENSYPNASILEAFGKGMGVFCAFNRTEIVNHYIETNNEIDGIKANKIFAEPVTYCSDEDDVLSAASDFITKHTVYSQKDNPLKCTFEYKEEYDNYIPDIKTTKMLQNIFAALSYCKEYSLDNEKEFRITVMGEMRDYSFYKVKESLKFARLNYTDEMLKELIILNCEYNELRASLYEGDCKEIDSSGKSTCSTRTNLFNEIICDSGFSLKEFSYGGSYYKHFRRDEKQENNKAVKIYVWDK
jgi:hypothetical protein